MEFVRTRGGVGQDIRWIVKTLSFAGLDVGGSVKTRGFVDPGVSGLRKAPTPSGLTLRPNFDIDIYIEREREREIQRYLNKNLDAPLRGSGLELSPPRHTARSTKRTCFHAPTYAQACKTTCFHDPTYVLAHTTSCAHELHPDSSKHARNLIEIVIEVVIAAC